MLPDGTSIRSVILMFCPVVKVTDGWITLPSSSVAVKLNVVVSNAGFVVFLMILMNEVLSLTNSQNSACHGSKSIGPSPTFG